MEGVTDENEYIEFTEITLLRMLKKKFPPTSWRRSPDMITWSYKRGVNVEFRFQRRMTLDELITLEEVLGLKVLMVFGTLDKA